MGHVMGHGARRWLIGLAGVTVAGATALSLAPMANASTAKASQAARATRISAMAHPVSSIKYRPTRKTFRLGMRGPAIKALQHRLNSLHYYSGKPDGRFGWDTMEAVWAFKEVQAGKAIPKNADLVTPRMQRQLLHPKLPKVLLRHAHWTRIEVHKNIGVLVLYHGRKIKLISHVSTAAACRAEDGCGWITRDGKYRAWEYIAGPVADSKFGGFMYNPVFFIGTSYAIHGMPNPTSTFSGDGVPLNAASHGCVRIPMDISTFLHKLIKISPSTGSFVYIFGHPQADRGA